jgi:thiol-disulfide isomerase/thioredoxin
MRVAGHQATQRRGPIARGFLGLLGGLLLSSISQAADLDLSAYRGKVVYLDFWASWCGPCKQSFPWMQAMKETYDRQGLTVIAVNLDMDRADADKFLERFRPTFEVRFDPNGKLAAFYKVFERLAILGFRGEHRDSTRSALRHRRLQIDRESISSGASFALKRPAEFGALGLEFLRAPGAVG